MAQTVKVVTRSTASNTSATNPAYGESDTSTNKGAALTSSEMDMNLLNLKDAIEGTSTRMDEAHNEDGSIKSLSVDGGDLSANSVDYSKIKSVHYGVDGGSVANTMTFAATGLAALEDGMLFLVKVSNANTGAATLEVTGSSGSLGAKSVYKNKDTPLISGDLKAGEMVGMLYDLSNTAFQLLGGGVEDSIALAALATQSSGNLISFATGGGAPVLVPAGTAGQVLTGNANNEPPSFQNTGIAPLIELTSPSPDTYAGDVQTGESNGQFWVPPSGVTKIRVCLQAGGGAGSSVNLGAGSGGGGGEYTESEFTVASNQVYQIVVGEGAAGPTDYTAWDDGLAGETSSFSLVSGYGSTDGELTTTLKASAVGGGSSNTSTVVGTGGTGGTQNLKTVPGAAGGAISVPYPGATTQGDNDLGGHGGASYKGTPGFGAIGSSSDEGKQCDGIGYGWGGAGGYGFYSQNTTTSSTPARGGGGGWAAIYNIT